MTSNLYVHFGVSQLSTSTESKKSAQPDEDVGWIKNLWHLLYIGAFSFGLFKVSSFLDKPPSYGAILLYIFTFVLWFRFWWFDNVRPGYKRRYPCQDHPEAWRAYALGFLVIAMISLVFFLIEAPPYYMAALAFLYLAKALWHVFHKRLIEKDANCENALRLAAVSDAVIATIFGIYSLFFITNFLLAPLIQLPPILTIDLNSEPFKFVMGIFIVGVVSALEVHYSICAKLVEDITRVH